MIGRLFRVEVRRLTARRAVWALATFAVVAVLAWFAVEMVTSRKLDPAMRQRIEQAEREGLLVDVFDQESVPADTAPPGHVPLEGDAPPSGIEPGTEGPTDVPGTEGPLGGPGSEAEGQLTQAEVQAWQREFRLRGNLEGATIGFGVLVVVIAFLVGATAGGAEWSAGTMQALLFWEPRRVRVILVKALAVAAAVVAFAVLLQALVTGLAVLLALVRGSTRGMDADIWRSLLGGSLRVAVLPMFSALLGFGIAGFTRNTGFALGAAFVYFAILENVLRLWKPRIAPYVISENIGAWLQNGSTIYFPPTRPDGPDQTFYNSGTRAGLVLAVYLVVVVGVLTATFARRDVT